MKNYEKPVVMVNEELAEGVYAASGCWSGRVTNEQQWDGSSHVFELIINHTDSVEHISSGFSMSVSFNYAITAARVNDATSCSFSGNNVVFEIGGHGNGYKSGDNKEVKIWVSAADEATTKALSVTAIDFVSCGKQVNVQGGGANE